MSDLPEFSRESLDQYEQWIEDGKYVENMFGVLSLVQSHRRALDEIDRLCAEKAALLVDAQLYKDVLAEQGFSYDPHQFNLNRLHNAPRLPVRDYEAKSGPIETMTVDIPESVVDPDSAKGRETYGVTGDEWWIGPERKAASIRAAKTIVPQNAGPVESDYKDDPDRHAYLAVDITQDHDVRAGQRRLVEVDYAGNVVCEWTQKR